MHCREPPSCQHSVDSSVMELYVETLTGTAFELRVSPVDKISSVKAKIQRMEGIPVAQQHLIWQSKELEDDCCLKDYRITNGATVKLVLAMRGGPINTRRVPIEDPTWREMMEYMEANREEIWEKLPGGRQVTLLVFRDGDQINFFRVIDRGDGTLSPLTESLSGSSMRPLHEEETEDMAAQARVVENAVTLQKMHALRKKMDALTLKKKPKKFRSHLFPTTHHRPTSSTSNHQHHFVSVKPKIHVGGFSLNKHTRLPPVAVSSPPLRPNSNQAADSAIAHLEDLVENEIAHSIAPPKTGTLPKLVRQPVMGEELPKGIARTRQVSFSALDTYRRSLMQLPPTLATPEQGTEVVDDQQDPIVAATATSATTVKPKTVVVPRLNRNISSKRKVLYAGRRLESLDAADIQQTLSKFDPRITVGRNSIAGDGRGRRDRMLENTMGLPSYLELHPVEKVMDLRPKTSPEKWDRSMSDVSLRSSPEAVSSTGTSVSKDVCYDILTRTSTPRMRLRSQGSTMVATTSSGSHLPCDRDRRRSHSIDPLSDIGTDSEEYQAEGGDCPQDLELVTTLLSSPEERQPEMLKKYSLEDNKAVAQKISLKATQLLLRLSTSRPSQLSSSAPKLPPVTVPKKLSADAVAPRCRVCNKKTGLATTYTCRCGKKFCAAHRYAETHDCTFDYKTEGRRLLEQANPLVAASKLPKI